MSTTRKNIGRLDMPPVFSVEGGRRMCSNAWAAAMMRRDARKARVFDIEWSQRAARARAGIALSAK